MLPPKSPLKKPSSHTRRSSGARRSSNEKVTTKSTKHVLKPNSTPQGKSRDTMSDSLPGVDSPTEYQSDVNIREPVKKGTIDSLEQPAPKHDAPSNLSQAEERVSHDDDDDDDEEDKEDEEAVAAKVGEHTTSAEQVERLREAMNAQLQLSRQRERLTRQLEDTEARDVVASAIPSIRARVSPIHEEMVSPSMDEAFASPLPTGQETTSTESAKTIRGGTTPGPMAVRTPSYPFPSMRTPQHSYMGHRPFTALSPTVNPANYAGGTFDSGPQDHSVSGSVTPASTLKFQPPDSSHPQDPNFETPNLYDLSLMLSAEPGLDAWWTTVVEIMRTVYHAHRVTLSVPADPTDTENVPWGQKATFNALHDDELSLTYLARGNSFVPSSADTNDTSNSGDTSRHDESNPSTPSGAVRPGLPSRHSFTAYEDSKKVFPSPSDRLSLAARPTPLLRAKSYLSARPDLPPRSATLQNAELNLQTLQDHMAFEDAKQSAWENPESASREIRGQVFPVLQALDYEAEPLIDNKGVMRVLERCKVIALTRDYPYVEPVTDERSGGSKSSAKSKESPVDTKKNKATDVGSRIASFFGHKTRTRRARSQTSDKGRSMPSSRRSLDLNNEEEDVAVPSTVPRYEEYEQAPPSPWSQSPAPSPAVRVETSDNPFFENTPIDEETFNPREKTHDYADMPQPETIGADRSWSVLHVPLNHPLLSKPTQSFRLNTAAMESKTTRGKVAAVYKTVDNVKDKEKQDRKDKATPIAVLSILSPVIPYPSVLRHSLGHLSAHLATSFSLCRHFTNLETEVAGLSRKRPQMTGFGAVAPGGRPRTGALDLSKNVYSPADESGPQRSTGGSITSPSDYSGLSRSTADSPAITPAWDPSSLGFSTDKRSSGGSPGYVAGESYFSSRMRPGLGRVDTGSGSSVTGARRTSKEVSPAESRSQKVSAMSEETTKVVDHAVVDTPIQERDEIDGLESSTSTPKQEQQQCASRSSFTDNIEARDASPSRLQNDSALSPRRLAMRTASTLSASKPDRQHTLLHSYGGDFGATFPALPATTGPAKTPAAKGHTRSGSLGSDVMPPPSDRVKGLMLDMLPLHIFIALPPTGEIVWVNSRYLSYRGQSVQDLYSDPWASIHPEEKDEYLEAWATSIRTGEAFSMQVRLRRFTGDYRWHFTRAVGLKDRSGVIVQWYGTHMDIHDQHIAEVKAARQEEIEASEAKHKQLANLIPQIIFSATEEEGVTFANQQWLSYTGQPFNESLGIGFMAYVHPDDLARCHIPFGLPPNLAAPGPKKPAEPSRYTSHTSSGGKSSNKSGHSEATETHTIRGQYQSLSRTNSSSSSSVYELPSADLAELTRSGVIKVDKDSNGRVSYSTEVRLRSKDGEYRWHLVRCVEVDNINLGSKDGSWFGACADINDHKILEMKLKEAMESKGRFLSNMSHEIRTPLIGISGMVGFLQDTKLDSDQTDFCNTIAMSAEGLLRIINDILDLAKVDAGMMSLKYVWFHTRSLVEEVNETVSTLAIQKHLDINYVVDADVPKWIKGDRMRIRQVLLNVIGNAIKFTGSGEVFSHCTVKVEHDIELAENEILLEFSVIDTGRGFTQEEAEMIFKPFSQIDGSSTRTAGGTGLGLVISRQLVELHGGKMEGTAIPGKGSTFTFTAKFNVPTADDHPIEPETPGVSEVPSALTSLRSSLSEAPQRLMKVGTAPAAMTSGIIDSPNAESPRDSVLTDSPAVLSSGSSQPSQHSVRSHATRSSNSSMAGSLSRFSEAARMSPDPSNMKLALPDRVSPPLGSSSSQSETSGATPTPQSTQASGLTSLRSGSPADAKHFRPPMFSILLICPQTHSREALTQHIEMTLPKDIPHQITGLASVEEAKQMIGGDDPVIFTHIVLNLGSTDDIVALVDQIVASISLPSTSIVVLSDPLQRQEVMKSATIYDYEQLAKDNRVTFIYKPIKPSRLAVIFDPDKERDLSTDRNRSSAQQQVLDQRQNYIDISKRLGKKGFRILLVEDNLVNQKVLLKFLSKVGIDVDLALDGEDCTNRVFGKPHSFYSLILCDLHMPNKDGYQACREIREWEKNESHPAMPIIALSANVMADVLDKCIAAGFTNYITKPVDFKALSTLMGDLLDPTGSIRSLPL